MDPWHMASAVACTVAAVVLAVIVLHPGIREGLLVKAGLVAMVLSLAATAALTFSGSTDWPGYWRAAFTLRAGLAVACVGILIKAHRMGRQARRRSPPDAQRQMTNRWLSRIAEPAHDLAYLFRDERQD